MLHFANMNSRSRCSWYTSRERIEPQTAFFYYQNLKNWKRERRVEYFQW